MATMYFTNPKGNDRLEQLWEDLRADPVPLHPPAPQARTVRAAGLGRQAEPMRRTWKVDLSTLFQSVLEAEVVEPPLPPTVAAIPEADAFSELSIEAAHAASLAMSTPFHWEPQPAWVNIPGNSTPTLVNPADPRRFAAKPKIPLRPLHKQPFYSRFYFYLRRWLDRQR